MLIYLCYKHFQWALYRFFVWDSVCVSESDCLCIAGRLKIYAVLWLAERWARPKELFWLAQASQAPKVLAGLEAVRWGPHHWAATFSGQCFGEELAHPKGYTAAFRRLLKVILPWIYAIMVSIKVRLAQGSSGDHLHLLVVVRDIIVLYLLWLTEQVGMYGM